MGPSHYCGPGVSCRGFNTRCALITGQIIALQALHYVTLSFLVPPLLVMLAEHGLLDYQGGVADSYMPFAL